MRITHITVVNNYNITLALYDVLAASSSNAQVESLLETGDIILPDDIRFTRSENAPHAERLYIVNDNVIDVEHTLSIVILIDGGPVW